MTTRPTERSPLPPIPTGSAAHRLPFDDAAVATLSAALGCDVGPAPFGTGGEPVHRLRLPLLPGPVARGGADGAGPGPAPLRVDGEALVTTVTLWPALGRVDVASAAIAATITGVVVVDLIPGIEAIFRSPTGSLTLTRHGRVAVRVDPR